MTHYEELFEISKILLAEEDYERIAQDLLGRIVDRCGAESGFLVVREEGSYQHRFEVGGRRTERSDLERRFSRTLVREAIESREMVYIPSLGDAPRFAAQESTPLIGRCSALAAPLRHGGEVYGVLYLEDRSHLDRFDAGVRRFVTEFAELAGLFLRRALERETLRQRSQSFERELFARYRFPGIVGRHPRMVEALRLVAQVADSETTILVHGETGTGKELIAQALHANSARRSGPFVTVPCSALPSTLLESELFGYAAGAFTDARRERAGRLAAAHGGTLFLDEVGEIPPEAQAKLLRFLQFGEIHRVGSDRTEKVDVRILAATHRDLKAMVADGRFRQDLYFRLRVLEVHLPPLRERRSDVLLLADHFLHRFWRRPTEPPRWTVRAEQALSAYSYPGNVRELAHLVERACLLAHGPELDLDLLPEEVTGGPPVVPEELPELTSEALNAARAASVAAVERRFVEALMHRTRGNVSRAAREAGLNRSYLQKLLARHRREPAAGLEP